MNARRTAASLMLLAAAGGAFAVAAPKKVSAPAKSSATIGAWTLVTTEIEANMKTGAFKAPKHVKMTRADGSVVEADKATGNYKKKQAVLTGNVSVHDASGTFGLKSAAAVKHDPATLTADTVKVDDVTHLYDANGSVHYAQGQTAVDAQTAHLNDITHRLDLSGKVHVVQGERTLDADTATYNTVTGDGEADGNAMMTFPGAPISIATPKPITLHGPKIP
jgi:lipopolysaccharide assembly outer membrane protein LptD (OstA)